MKRQIAFFGTPDFSARLLERIVHELGGSTEVKLVITQPDKKVGRKQIITPSPVKIAAMSLKLPVHEGLPSPEALKGIDLAVLYAYGEIITREILTAPKHGIWNIHPSLLPLYRSSAVMMYPLLLGDAKTGVTLMQMDEKLDHGPIIAQREFPLTPTSTRVMLETELTDIGFSLLAESLERLSIESIEATEQNHEEATFTREVRKDDGYIPLETLKQSLDPQAAYETGFVPDVLARYYKRNPKVPVRPLTAAETVWNMYRALHPWPGIWTKVNVDGEEKRLKITNIAYGKMLALSTVQLEGKKEVDFATFNRAYSLF